MISIYENKKQNKVDDVELSYWIILSQGKGFLVPEASELLLKLCKKTMEVMYSHYRTDEDREDAFMSGVYSVMKNYMGYQRRFKSYPYFTEIFIRGLYHSVNFELMYTKNKNTISLDSVLDYNRKEL